MTQAITQFRGEYRFLSNFWLVLTPVHYEGLDFATVEHAYQAAKCHLVEHRLRIKHAVTPGEAKRLGRNITIRADWEQIKVAVMRDLLFQKFAEPTLRAKLLATGDAELCENNTWGDTFWGVCNGVGQNWLGRLLMEVRAAAIP